MRWTAASPPVYQDLAPGPIMSVAPELLHGREPTGRVAGVFRLFNRQQAS